jgi:hypothetical protein
VSRASARQRKGRAGRVQPGACFHLFSQTQHAYLDAQQPPEMLRVPLESLCLQVTPLVPSLLPDASYTHRRVGGSAVGAPALTCAQGFQANRCVHVGQPGPCEWVGQCVLFQRVHACVLCSCVELRCACR